MRDTCASLSISRNSRGASRIRAHHTSGCTGHCPCLIPHSTSTRSKGADAMTIKIVPNEKGNPPGKLADAELHFTDGPLQGLKLIGFGIWERKTGSGRNVTFPARQYSVNGERRSFSLLRPVSDATSQERIRDVILQAYTEHEAEAVVSS
jgi:hypothetical protein